MTKLRFALLLLPLAGLVALDTVLRAETQHYDVAFTFHLDAMQKWAKENLTNHKVDVRVMAADGFSEDLTFKQFEQRLRGECVQTATGSTAVVIADMPGTPPATIDLKGSSATVLALEFNNTSTAPWREWLAKAQASHKAEMRIDIDGKRVEMTFAEFQRRVFGEQP